MPGEQSDTYTETGSPLVLDTEKTTVQQSTITESLTVEDDDDIRWGTDDDFITEYDSGNDRWRLFDNANSQDLLYGEKNGPLQSVVDFNLGGNHLTNADELDFNEVSQPTHASGQLYYDTDLKTLSFDTDQTGVTVNIGEENIIRVRNNTGSQINNGDVVYISGFHANSGSPEVSLAQADSESASLIAGMATQNIQNGTSGYITSQGIVRGIDTSAFSNGDELWLSTSEAGGIQTTEPSDPNFSVKIGTVARATVGAGEIRLNPDTRRPALYTSGSVMFANSNGRITQDNSELFWDNTSKELGIGTSDPSATLDVQGDITQSGSDSSIIHDRQDVSSDVSSDGSGYYSIDTSGGSRTFTVASTDAVDGREINIKRNGGNSVDINTEGSETIDDVSTAPQLTLSSDNESVTLVYNSTNIDWEVY